jgi:hypothetical protein
VVETFKSDTRDPHQPFQVSADTGHLAPDRGTQIGFTQAHVADRRPVM